MRHSSVTDRLALRAGVLAVICLAALALASRARAVVVDISQADSGKQSVAFDPAAKSNYLGVALVPGTRGQLATVGMPIVTMPLPCVDPAMAVEMDLFPNLTSPPGALCYHSGGDSTGSPHVLHGSETFALTWDAGNGAGRSYWAGTRDYLEQFLRDVADASGALGSPYAVTTQYWDGKSGKDSSAVNDSVYGGGCIDYGSVGGADCRFPNSDASFPGYDYPDAQSGCSSTGQTCVTDAQIQDELRRSIVNMGLIGRTAPGHWPLIAVLTPEPVKVCLDSSGRLCSATPDATTGFCSYHGEVSVPGAAHPVPYVVQPWTAGSECDEPQIPNLHNPPLQAGMGLVSPLSGSQIAAIVNPYLDGWFAADGSEIDDNVVPGQRDAVEGCVRDAKNNDTVGPRDFNDDKVTIGANAYSIQPEFNQAGVMEYDPYAPRCALTVALSPTFVVPSAVEHGDVVAFDGSTTVSTLMIPRKGYVWDFGDGTTAIGPSVVHTYANGGTYNVKLSVTDRGVNVATVTQSVDVLPKTGTPGAPGSAPQISMQLMPQSLSAVLRSGIAIHVNSSAPADGIVTVSITHDVAKRARISGSGASVTIGRGTISGPITNGTVNLRLRLARTVARKLAHLRHATFTIRLVLVASGGRRVALVAAGQY